MENGGQPRRGRSTSPLREVSPERKARVQEKDELAHLNNRLERYIVRVREVVATPAGGPVEGSGVSVSDHEREIHRIRKEYEERIRDLKAAKDKAVADAQELQRRMARDQEARLAAERALALVEKRLEEAQRKYLELAEKVHGAEHSAALAEDEISSLKLKISQLKDEIKRLNSEVDRSNARAESANSERARREAELQSQLDEALVKISSLEEEIGHGSRSLPSGPSGQSEQAIREELTRRMNELVEENRRRLQEERDAEIQEQKELYNRLIDELRQQKSDAEEKSNGYREKLTALEQRLQETLRDKSTLVKQVEFLENQLAALRKELDEATSVSDHGREAEIAQLKRRIYELERQIETLAPLRVPLEHAIQTYERLVTEEEERLRIVGRSRSASPSKAAAAKKKNFDESPKSKQPPPREDPDDEDDAQQGSRKRRRTGW